MSVDSRRNISGDTIIEVLIAIAVSASVIALTYITMNKNIAITQANQDRIEATRIIQSQIEALRVSHHDILQSLTIPNAPFCFNAGRITELPLGAVNDNLTSDDYSLYGDDLVGCSNGDYRIGVKGDTVDARQYVIYVRWDRTGGRSKTIYENRDEIKMTYRVGL